ncbi:hypothetical protein GQ44DRAFT_46510 [Phaeosphaeriaceae sp. PMI808]|nr:hypothetical protein GQ44DRAFT_46510 [Phaeosphaeriaceae sp. PMI808]
MVRMLLSCPLPDFSLSIVCYYHLRLAIFPIIWLFVFCACSLFRACLPDVYLIAIICLSSVSYDLSSSQLCITFYVSLTMLYSNLPFQQQQQQQQPVSTYLPGGLGNLTTLPYSNGTQGAETGHYNGTMSPGAGGNNQNGTNGNGANDNGAFAHQLP